MELVHKQILIYLAAISIGLLIVFSGLSEGAHDFSIRIFMPLIKKYSKNPDELSVSIGYTLQLLISTLLLISPMSAASGIWFVKIAYDLTFGKDAAVNAFVLSPFLNKVMAVLCMLLFLYSFYYQRVWAVKLTEPLPVRTNDKDLSRLI